MLTIFKEIFIWWNRQTLGTRIHTIFFGKLVGKDIYGNKIKGTEVALADELAAAAGLLMGQSNEKKPVVIIKGYQGINEIDKDAVNLIVKDNDDLYR